MAQTMDYRLLKNYKPKNMRVARIVGLLVGIVLNRLIWDVYLTDVSAGEFNIWRLISAVMLAMFFAGLFQSGYDKFIAKKE